MPIEFWVRYDRLLCADWIETDLDESYSAALAYWMESEFA